MEPLDNTTDRFGNNVPGAAGRVRNMFGSKRRLMAPFIVAAVLVSLVGLFMMVSENLLSPLAEDEAMTFLWNENMTPSVIMPAGLDGIEPEGEYPEDVDLFTVSGAGSTFFLRSFVATEYDGKLWKKDKVDKPIKYGGEILSFDVSNFSDVKVDTITVTPLEEFPRQFLPTSLYTTQLDHPDPVLLYPGTATFYVQRKTDNPYQFTTNNYSFDDEVLKAAEVLDDAKYTQLPDNISQRTKDLAQEITQDYESPYQKSKAIETYLITNYEFSKGEVLSPPETYESTDWFLFETKEGYSNSFASAYAVLARCVDIPARLTSGYYIAPTDELQTVSSIQTLYLAEVGFKGLGWIIYNSMPLTEGGDIIVETKTDIWSIQNDPVYDPENPVLDGVVIQKDTPFYVIGTVTTLPGGITLPGMPVVVWLWQGDESDKPEFINGMPDKYAAYVANGLVENDGYNVECVVPTDLPAGNWNIIVQSLGFESFLAPSDSDPAIVITAPSKLDLLIPNDPRVGVPGFYIAGSLQDAIYAANPTNPDIPILAIAGETVEIEIVDVDSGQLVDTRSATTMPSGDFVVPFYTFTDYGNYSINVSFAGNEFYSAAKDTVNTKVTIDTVLTLDVLDKIKLDTEQTISGTLTDTYFPSRLLANRTISIYFDNVLIDDTVTDSDGEFKLDYTFDVRGEHTVRVEYDGGGLFGVDEAEDPTFGFFNSSMEEKVIRVYGPPTLILTMDQDVDISSDTNGNGLIEEDEKRITPVYVSLIDEFGYPVKEEIIHFFSIKNDVSVLIGDVETDDDGIYGGSISYRSVGELTISAVFDGTGHDYLPGAEASVDVTVWMPTSITMNALVDEITYGTTLTIDGSLLDDVGDPLVAGTTVYIMNGQDVLTQTTTDGLGNYSVDYTFNESGDYNVYAKFAVDSDNYYKESTSATVADIRVFGVPTLDLTLPAREDINDQPVYTQVHLYNEFGDLEGQTITIQYSDGSPDEMFVTSGSGRFVFPHTFAAVGDYTVTADFAGAGLIPGNTTVGNIKIMMPTVLTVSVPEEQKLGESITINGTLEDVDGTPLAGETITLLDGSTLIDTVITLGDGSYTYDHTFTESGDHAVNAAFAEKGYLKSSAASDVIRVYGPPTIDITPVAQTLAYEPFTINGHMYDQFGTDLVGYTVNIHVNDGSPDVQVDTVAGGLFSLEHIFNASGDYEITASFAGAGFYPAAADDSYDIKVLTPTTLTISMPQYARTHEPIGYTVILTETVSGDQIGDQIIRFYHRYDEPFPVLWREWTLPPAGTIETAVHYNGLPIQGTHEFSIEFDQNDDDYLAASSAEHTIVVRDDSFLEFYTTKVTDIEDSISYVGHLLDIFDNPIEGQTVHIHLGSKKRETRVVTDASGGFVLENVLDIAGVLTDGDGLPIANQTIDLKVITDAGLDISPPSNPFTYEQITQMVTNANGEFELSVPLDLKGTLTDSNGDPLDAHTIDLLLDQSAFFPEALLLTDVDGVFSLPHEFWFDGTVTTQDGQLVSGAVIDLLLDDGADSTELALAETGNDGAFMIGRALRLGGTLKGVGDDPIPHTEVQMIFPVDDPGMWVTAVTDEDGEYSYNWDDGFDEAGTYVATVFFYGDEQHMPSHASSDIIVMMPTTISAEVIAPVQPMVGDTVSILVTLLDDYGQPVAGQTVWVIIPSENGSEVFDQFYSGDGLYTFDHAFDREGEYFLQTFFEGFGYFRESSSDMIFTVMAQPVIAFSEQMPQSADEFDAIPIQGTILGSDDSPLEQIPLKIIVNYDNGQSITIYASLQTDLNGVFKVEDHLFADSGPYTITASVEESGLYLSAANVFNMQIGEADYGVTLLTTTETVQDYMSWVLWVITVIGALGAAYITYLIIRSRRRVGYAMAITQTAVALDELVVLEIPETPAKMVRPHNPNLLTTHIEVLFPYAVAPLEGIWGINEKLKIVCKLTDIAGEPISTRSIEMLANDNKISEIITDGHGTDVYMFRFKVQGIYNVTCFFNGDQKYAPSNDSRTIKIVDYREEAVSLLDSIVSATRESRVYIDVKSTPREIESIIVSSVKDMDQRKLDRFISFCEEALYSSHDFTRESFIDMLNVYWPVFEYIAGKDIDKGKPTGYSGTALYSSHGFTRESYSDNLNAYRSVVEPIEGE